MKILENVKWGIEKLKKFRLKKRSICRDRDNDRKENKIEGVYGYL